MSENKSAINGAFRKKKVYFSQVSNVAIRDLDLSLKAKGLYALIQSYITIENFTLYKATLKKQCLEGEKAFESTWKELKEAGYLIQYRLQGEKGCYYYEYELLDEPNKELAEQIHSRQNRKSQSEKSHNPKKGCMDKNTVKQSNIHNPKRDVMDMAYDGQVGVYNNTDSNNTDFINTDINTTGASEDAVVDTQQEEVIVNETNIKELTAHQKKKVSKWDIDTLVRAIKIYKRENGLYFKLLEKIYKDGAINSLTGKKGSRDVNKGIIRHDWNIDEFERLEQEYIERKLHGYDALN